MGRRGLVILSKSGLITNSRWCTSGRLSCPSCPSLLMAAKYCLIIMVLASLGGLQFILPGCNEVQLAGIVQLYWGR